MQYLLVAAVLPIVILCIFVYKKDPHHEPGGLLAKIFILGFVSAIPVVIVEMILGKFFPTDEVSNFILIFINVFISVAVVEEGFKWLVTMLFGYKNKEFDEVYDIIVYAVFASLGFALIENVLYVLSNGFLTGLLRAFTSVPAHTCTGILMGYYLGLSKTEELKGNQSVSNKYMLYSIIVPALLHTLYDTFAMSKLNNSFYLFIVCTVFLYVTSLSLIKKVSKNNTKYIGECPTNGENFKYARKTIIIITVITTIVAIGIKVCNFIGVI